MAVSSDSLAGALHSARRGLLDAQQLAQRAARSRATDPQFTPHAEQSSAQTEDREARQRRDLLRDMVELSQARQQASINAAVFRTVDNISLEAVNLGRRIDIRA